MSSAATDLLLPDQVATAVEKVTASSILEVGAVAGGCIASARKVRTSKGSFFLKFSTGEPADTFEAEAAGLEALRAAESPLRVPKVYAARAKSGSEAGFLLVEWIEQGRRDRKFSAGFGAGLAELHRHRGPAYGFDHDNFIGLVRQENGWLDAWPEFFVERRLGPQVSLAQRSGRWLSAWNASYERLMSRITEILPAQPAASMLHGDLWSGNYLASSTGQAALIDPAVYYGHRETDLALSELFGGFDSHFYEVYREVWPLEDGYDVRRDVYNLYHLINHLNHFGNAYVSGIDRVLRRFG